MIDPFSDEADPPRLDGTLPPETDGSTKPGLGRRAFVTVLATVPLVLGGCVHTAPACPTAPASARHCRHRFCRYAYER